MTKGDETAFIPKDCFPGRDGVSRYFDYLPAKLEIYPPQVDAGLSIVIDNMDSWLGNSVLREKYRADTGLGMMNMKSKLLRFKQSNKEKQWRKLSSNCSRRSKNKKKKKECEKNSDTN